MTGVLEDVSIDKCVVCGLEAEDVLFGDEIIFGLCVVVEVLFVEVE